MKRLLLTAALSLAVAGAALAAEFKLNDEVMQTIEDIAKSLDSNIGLKDPKALSEAQELAVLFAQVEAYYVKRGDAPDAVSFAQKTRAHAEQAAQQLAANNYDAATDSVFALARSCKGCHDAYKKK